MGVWINRTLFWPLRFLLHPTRFKNSCRLSVYFWGEFFVNVTQRLSSTIWRLPFPRSCSSYQSRSRRPYCGHHSCIKWSRTEWLKNAEMGYFFVRLRHIRTTTLKIVWTTKTEKWSERPNRKNVRTTKQKKCQDDQTENPCASIKNEQSVQKYLPPSFSLTII